MGNSSPRELPLGLEAKEKNVLLLGDLFAKNAVAAQVVKELFSQLLFCQNPSEASVELGRRLQERVRATLELTPQGQQLRHLVELRLHEVGPAPVSGRSFSFQPGQTCKAW